jgi:hypothetical protein
MRMTARTHTETFGIDFEKAPAALAAARTAVADRLLGYALLVAAKPV